MTHQRQYSTATHLLDSHLVQHLLMRVRPLAAHAGHKLHLQAGPGKPKCVPRKAQKRASRASAVLQSWGLIWLAHPSRYSDQVYAQTKHARMRYTPTPYSAHLACCECTHCDSRRWVCTHVCTPHHHHPAHLLGVIELVDAARLDARGRSPEAAHNEAAPHVQPDVAGSSARQGNRACVARGWAFARKLMAACWMLAVSGGQGMWPCARAAGHSGVKSSQPRQLYNRFACTCTNAMGVYGKELAHMHAHMYVHARTHTLSAAGTHRSRSTGAR